MPAVKFLKKEFNEIIKTHKIFVLPAIFLFFGFLSPLLCKYTPEILKSVGGVTLDPKLFNTTYTGAYEQLFKNINQMGFIIMILVFMGIVVDEKIKGSVTMVLTKSLSRNWFILDKFIAATALYTLSFILAAGACTYYSFLLFAEFSTANLLIGLLLLWVYGIFIISFTIFSSTISKSHVISAVISLVIFLGTSAIGAIPKVGDYLPGALSSLGLGLITGTSKSGDIFLPLIVCIALILVFISLAVTAFRKQEL